MDLNIGDRLLVKFSDERAPEEDEVAEQWGEYVRWLNHYPHWLKIGQFSVIGKLPKKEKPTYIRPKLTWATEGLDCPLLKKVCNRNCAWYNQISKSCILLQLADDISTAVDDDT